MGYDTIPDEEIKIGSLVAALEIGIMEILENRIMIAIVATQNFNFVPTSAWYFFISMFIKSYDILVNFQYSVFVLELWIQKQTFKR